MTREQDDYITLRSYQTVWTFPKKLYSIDRIKLWFPLVANEVLFFVLGLILVLGLSEIPVIAKIPFIIRYGVIPYLVMRFFTKKKFDGKVPHKFALGYLEYIMIPTRLSRFKAGISYTDGRLQDTIYRGTDIINVIEERLQHEKIKSGKRKRKGRKK